MEVDISYSLNFLRKINNLTINGKSIDTHFVENEYSLWSFQQFYLLSQIKEFSQYKTSDTYKKTKKENDSFFVTLNVTAMNIFIVFISFLALVKLYVLRPKLLLFCSDILKHGTRFNPRIYTIYLALQKEQIPFFEIVHTVGGKKVISNFIKLRRLVFYSESINALFGWCKKREEEMRDNLLLEKVSLDAFSESEKKFVYELLERTFENIRITRFKIKILRRILSQSSISTFVTIDDIRHTNEIIAACRSVGVHSCIYQHSNFDYLIGLEQLPPDRYVFPDTFLVWNDYWYKRIPELSPVFFANKDRLKIGGRAYAFTPGECKEENRGEKTEDSSVSVFIPYEVNLSTSHIRPYMEAMVQDSRINIFLLLRDDVDSETQIRKYFVPTDLDNPRVTIVRSTEKAETFKKVDIVLGVYSGFLDESVEICRPVGIFETEYPVFNQLDEGGVADKVTLGNNGLYAQLLAIKNTPYEIRKERREKFLSGAGDSQKSVLEILAT